MTYAIEGRDMLLHILCSLDLFGMKIESSLDNRGIDLFPFLLRQENILSAETL